MWSEVRPNAFASSLKPHAYFLLRLSFWNGQTTRRAEKAARLVLNHVVCQTRTLIHDSCFGCRPGSIRGQAGQFLICGLVLNNPLQNSNKPAKDLMGKAIAHANLLNHMPRQLMISSSLLRKSVSNAVHGDSPRLHNVVIKLSNPNMGRSPMHSNGPLPVANGIP